jgi:hypothetical protein
MAEASVEQPEDVDVIKYSNTFSCFLNIRGHLNRTTFLNSYDSSVHYLCMNNSYKLTKLRDSRWQRCSI